MRRLFSLPYAAHMTRTDDYTKRFGVASGATQAEYDHMLTAFFDRSVYLKKPYPFFAGQIAASRDMAPKSDILGSDIYQGWNKERDIHEMLRLGLTSSGGVSELITFGRPWSAGPFQARELRMCRVLMPHLQAASAVAGRLRGADLFASAALSGLNRLNHAVLLLDPAARLFHANDAAEAMLAEAGVIRAARGVVQAATPTQSARLHAAFARALGHGALGASGVPSASYLRLPKPAGGAACIVLVLPVQGEA